MEHKNKRRRFRGLVAVLTGLLVLAGCTVTEAPTPPTPPETPEFQVTTGYERHEDVAETAMIDILLPEIVGSKAALEINEQIEDELDGLKNMTITELAEMGTGFYYPWLNVHYQVVEIDDLYSVIVFDQYASAAGSGVMTGVSRYHYDAEDDCVLTDGQYLEAVGLSRQDVVNAYYQALSEDLSGGDAAYEDIKRIYFIDEDRQPVVFISQ